MASSSQPRIIAYTAGGAIPKGSAVKKGADDQTVICGSANTSKVLGIAQNTAASGGVVEVAIQGGGGKGLLGETVSNGNLLVSHTDGSLVMANTIGDHLIAKAMQAGVAGDMIDVEIIFGHAAVAES